MPTIEIIEQIEAPPQQVWTVVNDIYLAPEWVTVMKAVLYVSEGDYGQGTVYRELSKIGPSQSETEWHITHFDPPRQQIHQCREATLAATLTLDLEPDGSGTRLTHKTDYQMMPAFRPLGWLLEKLFAQRLMASEMHQSVQNLKRLVEQHEPLTIEPR